MTGSFSNFAEYQSLKIGTSLTRAGIIRWTSRQHFLGMKDFEAIINTDWKRIYAESGPGVAISDEGVIFTLESVWDELKPLEYPDEEERAMMYSLLFHSKDMFNLLSEMEDPRAKGIVARILADRNMPNAE